MLVARIMIVDDEPNMLNSYKRIFRSTDYIVTCASSGKEALQQAAEFKPDIVLLDIMMPGMDGYTVCEEMKKIEEVKESEIVFISGKGKLDDRLKAYKLRASDFLVKPFSQDELLAKIELIIERRQFYLEMAVTDTLTQLGNRKYFEQKFETIFQLAQQYKQTFSIAIIDIDYFKRINDTYGHDRGDKVLEQIANRLKENLRKTDLVARIGGEEFAILLPETTKENAKLVLERLRKDIENRLAFESNDNKREQITISGGIASFPDDAAAKDDLFKRADQALYLAKQKGRNRVEKNSV